MKDGIFLIMDDSNSRCGITDRLKAAVGLYYIAKQRGADFHLIHTAGFDIRDYLVPNEVPWSAELTDISPLPWHRRRLRYVPPFDDIPELKRGIQYVCRRYIGKNVIEMQQVPEWQKLWRELFRELFSPSERVTAALARERLPERFAVINARFVNALGMNEDVSYNAPFPPREQERIIDAVLAEAAECEKRCDVPAVVYSDSVVFLKAAAERGFHTCDTDGIGHIMNRGVGESVYLKTFVNFFQMARAEAIYSILHVEGLPENCLYKTQYPRYAAIVGDRPFYRI